MCRHKVIITHYQKADVLCSVCIPQAGTLKHVLASESRQFSNRMNKTEWMTFSINNSVRDFDRDTDLLFSCIL